MVDAERYLNRKHEGQVLAALPNDYERYAYCRTQAEKLRNEWMEGLQSSVASVLASDDARYVNMSRVHRIIRGKRYWFDSDVAKDMLADSREYNVWAQQYLSAWQSHQLNTIIRLLQAQQRSD